MCVVFLLLRSHCLNSRYRNLTVTREHLEVAKARLRSFKFVGLNEVGGREKIYTNTKKKKKIIVKVCRAQ